MKKVNINELPELLEFAAETLRKSSKHDLGINDLTTDSVNMAQAEYDRRERRSMVFEDGLFFDPCWDMLIGLFIADANGRSVYITSLVDVSRVPPTTAMRYISSLERKGYIIRESSGEDRRRVRVILSRSGRETLERYFQGEHS